jgi:GntP family gluconate:H+ symporter
MPQRVYFWFFTKRTPMITGLPLLLIICLAIVFIIVASSMWKLHPFIALLLASFGVGLAVGMPLADIIKSVNSGFGGIMGYIGLIVVMGSIIGIILERSGAAMKIANLILQSCCFMLISKLG